MVYEFDEWYGRLHPRVISTVLVASGFDSDLATDAADEAFTRALGQWDRVAAMSSRDAWVCRVAVNVMRRRLRRRSVETRLLRLGRRPAAPQIPDAYPEVWDAVRGLPQRQRLAIVLRYVADLPEAEVADVMGVSRGAVSASLVAARGRLASSLSALADPVTADRSPAGSPLSTNPLPTETPDVEVPHG